MKQLMTKNHTRITANDAGQTGDTVRIKKGKKKENSKINYSIRKL